jgi:hypothetical protein
MGARDGNDQYNLYLKYLIFQIFFVFPGKILYLIFCDLDHKKYIFKSPLQNLIFVLHFLTG